MTQYNPVDFFHVIGRQEMRIYTLEANLVFVRGELDKAQTRIQDLEKELAAAAEKKQDPKDTKDGSEQNKGGGDGAEA